MVDHKFNQRQMIEADLQHFQFDFALESTHLQSWQPWCPGYTMHTQETLTFRQRRL